MNVKGKLIVHRDFNTYFLVPHKQVFNNQWYTILLTVSDIWAGHFLNVIALKVLMDKSTKLQ